MPDGRRRSREGWADAMEDGPTPSTAHTHRLPTAVRVAVIGLTAAVFLLLVAVAFLAVYVYQANQYVQGRGEFRDQETERTNQRINDAMCDLLDQLPAGGLLERPRAKYGCGPGIPLEQLTPEEQKQIAGRGVPTVETPLTVTPQPAPDLSSGAVQTPPVLPALPGDPHPPVRPAEPDPLVDLSPLTDAVCDAVSVCLGAPDA